MSRKDVPTFPVERKCSSRGCQAPSRPGGRYCRHHHAESSRRYRESAKRSRLDVHALKRDLAQAMSIIDRVRKELGDRHG